MKKAVVYNSDIICIYIVQIQVPTDEPKQNSNETMCVARILYIYVFFYRTPDILT